jgi:hypothetical protein
VSGRSIPTYILLLLTLTVAAVVAGTASVARAMFLSTHDLQVVVVTVAAAAMVSLGVGWVFASSETVQMLINELSPL